jgi:hypothetical protein
MRPALSPWMRVIFTGGKTTRHLRTFGRSSIPLQALVFLFVANLFSGFIAGRQPKAVSVVSGTGLILPTL